MDQETKTALEKVTAGLEAKDKEMEMSITTLSESLKSMESKMESGNKTISEGIAAARQEYGTLKDQIKVGFAAQQTNGKSNGTSRGSMRQGSEKPPEFAQDHCAGLCEDDDCEACKAVETKLLADGMREVTDLPGVEAQIEFLKQQRADGIDEKDLIGWNQIPEVMAAFEVSQVKEEFKRHGVPMPEGTPVAA